MESQYTEIKGDNVLERYKNIMKLGYKTDLVLHLKQDKSVNPEVEESVNEYFVHRILMAAASPVFDRMLYGLMIHEGPVVLKEPYPYLFPLLLEFVYTRGVVLENCCDTDKIFLLEMAHKYMMQDLVEICGSSIRLISITQDLYKFINLAMLYNVQSLKCSCSKIFTEHTKCSFQHAEFFTLLPESMSHILQLDEMYISSETEVFLAIIRWAETLLGFKKYIHRAPTTINQHTLVGEPIPNGYNSLISIRKNTEKPYGLESIENDVIIVLRIVELDTRYSSLQTTIISPQLSSDGSIDNAWTAENLGEINESSSEYGSAIRNFLEKSNCLQHIRFLAMDARQFCSSVISTKILTLDEINYILLYLTTGKKSLQHLPGICEHTNPRKKFMPKRNMEKHIVCVASVEFHFLNPHWFEVTSFLQFKEIFHCSSKKSLCIESVTIPAKEKKKNIISNFYDEEICIEMEEINRDGSRINMIASSNFKGKRRYAENKDFAFVYNMDSIGGTLKEGSYFSIGISVSKTAMYLGGFQYSQRCIDNDFIQVAETKQKGIIKGFTFSFRV